MARSEVSFENEPKQWNKNALKTMLAFTILVLGASMSIMTIAAGI